MYGLNFASLKDAEVRMRRMRVHDLTLSRAQNFSRTFDAVLKSLAKQPDQPQRVSGKGGAGASRVLVCACA
jgi:hypothetical protein